MIVSVTPNDNVAPDSPLLQLRADPFGERHRGRSGLALRLFVGRESGLRFALAGFRFFIVSL